MTRTPILAPPAEAMAVLNRLRQAGHTAYFCGGSIRDALMGRAPKDYDIATSAAPGEVESLFPRTVPIGKAFGVIVVAAPDGNNYEVATFRSDLGYADGRRPDAVRFSSPEEDARRRDFTLNALFYDPETDRVLDYVGGRRDIERRLLRTVGNPRERFEEDRLRLFRAVRFAARTGFEIEAETLSAMVELAHRAASVSPERVAAELELMLAGGHSRAAFALLKQCGLLRIVLPEVDALAGVEQPPDFHPEGDVWAHTLLLLAENDLAILGTPPPGRLRPGAGAAPDMHRGEFSDADYACGVRETRAALGDFETRTLSWSGLLHDIGKPGTFLVSDRIRFNEHDRIGADMAVGTLERLRRPRRMAEAAYDLIRRHIHFSTLGKMRKSKLRRWLASPSFPAHLELHRMDCAASHRMLANWHFGLQAWRAERSLPPVPEPLLRGGDIIALGVPPGPGVGDLLRRIEDARLEGVVGGREEALLLARDIASGRRE